MFRTSNLFWKKSSNFHPGFVFRAGQKPSFESMPCLKVSTTNLSKEIFNPLCKGLKRTYCNRISQQSFLHAHHSQIVRNVHPFHRSIHPIFKINILYQIRKYAVIKKRELKPSPYLKSIKFMFYFFAFTGFFFFILTRVDQIDPKLTPVNSQAKKLKLNRQEIEACLKKEQFEALPCLNKLRMQELVKKDEKDKPFYSDVLLEMAEKCDSMIEFSKADELYNDALETGEPRAYLAYGTYLYEKNRELHRSSDYLCEALKVLDPKAYSRIIPFINDGRTQNFEKERKQNKKAMRIMNKLQHEEKLKKEDEDEEQKLKRCQAGAAWNNIGMIFKSKAVDNPHDIGLNVVVMQCFQRGAYLGDDNAAYNAGLGFMTGHTGTVKYSSNYPLARKYFEQSKTIEAKLALAKLSESGLASSSGRPNLREAYEYYKQAHDDGYSHARYLKHLLKLTYIYVVSSILPKSRQGGE